MLHTISEIKAHAAAAGNYFFSPDAMRFFNSRISKRVYPVKDGAFFVTSERDWYTDNFRKYSVRVAREYDGTSGRGDFDISTIGEFGEFVTLAQAHTAAKRYASEYNA